MFLIRYIVVFLTLATVQIVGSDSSSTLMVFGQDEVDAGFDLLLNATKNQGDNPLVIRSGFVEYVLTTEETHNETEFVKNMESSKKEYKEMASQYPQIYHWEGDKEFEDRYRQQHVEYLNRRFLVKSTFRGLPSPISDEKEEYYEHFEDKNVSVAKDVQFRPTFTVIGKNVNKYGRSMYLRHSKNLGNNVSVEQNIGLNNIHLLGRMRGEKCKTLTALLLLTCPEEQVLRLEFDKNTVEQWRESNRKLLQDNPKSGIHVFAEKDTEDGHIYGVLMPGLGPRPKGMLANAARLLGKVVVWINPEKGYVTPLIEEYFDGIPIMKYESKNYFQDKHSGLWFPQTTIETTYNEKGEQILKETYEIDTKKSAWNIDIDDDEFSFLVSAGWGISDRQTGFQRDYRAVRDTRIRFNKNGRIAFNQSRDFVRDYPLLSVSNAANLLTWSWTRLIYFVMGAGFIAWALYRLRNDTPNDEGVKQ